MTIRNQYPCACCGIIALLLFGVGWSVVAGLIRRPHPDAGAEQIASFYRSGTGLIRPGLLMSRAGCVFFIPWVQLVSGTAAMLIILFPMMPWITA